MDDPIVFDKQAKKTMLKTGMNDNTVRQMQQYNVEHLIAHKKRPLDAKYGRAQ